MANNEVNKARVAITEQMKKLLGGVPDGTGDLLLVLIHPDMIDYTEEYVKAVRIADYNRLRSGE